MRRNTVQRWHSLLGCLCKPHRYPIGTLRKYASEHSRVCTFAHVDTHLCVHGHVYTVYNQQQTFWLHSPWRLMFFPLFPLVADSHFNSTTSTTCWAHLITPVRATRGIRRGKRRDSGCYTGTITWWILTQLRKAKQKAATIHYCFRCTLYVLYIVTTLHAQGFSYRTHLGLT